MLESFLGAILIMCMRIGDVTIGTMRTIQVVNGRKYYAALAGFFEVLLWIFTMRYVVQHMDHIINLIGYATGFALGNIFGISIEQKIGTGFVQINVISLHHTDIIANELRQLKHGVTIMPGEGGSGGVSIIVIITKRKHQRNVLKIIEKIDSKAFISVQPSIPYKGFIHGSRK